MGREAKPVRGDKGDMEFQNDLIIVGVVLRIIEN